jgi:hypothetical protein
MPFWQQVLIMVTLIALCWGSGYGVWRGVPTAGPWVPGLLGLLGLIILIVLIIMFIGGVGGGVSPDLRTR